MNSSTGQKRDRTCWIVYFLKGKKMVIGQSGKSKAAFGTKPFSSLTKARSYGNAWKGNWDNEFFVRTKNPERIPKTKPANWGSGYKIPKKKRK